MVFQTQNGRIVDLIDVKRKCSGQNASEVRFRQGMEIKWDQAEFLKKLEDVMVEAVRKRVQNIPGIAHSESGQFENTSVQVLFSGGLDSTLLAAILAKILDPQIQIDLVNVSFDPETSADRISSLFAFYELRKLSPHRKLRLLCADFEITQVMTNYEASLNSLIRPKQSHMDFNIGCALFLAAQAKNALAIDEERWFNSETFKNHKQQIEKIIDEKDTLKLEELKAQDSKAKSNDYKMATAEIKSIDVSAYIDLENKMPII